MPANGIGYHNIGLSAGTTYRYRVAAYNANGNSRYSTIRTITTLAAAAAQEEALAESASETTVQSWQQNQTPLVIDHNVACANGAQPTQVLLQAGGFTFPMRAVADQSQQYHVTIPASTQFAAATDYLVYLTWQCAEGATLMHEYIGLLQSAPDNASPAESAKRLYLPMIVSQWAD